MLETYQGILRHNQIEWSGEAPARLAPDEAVPVHVTLLRKAPAPAEGGSQGERMAAALEKLAAIPALPDIPDPSAWERETRADRPLPGRDA
jgi:hypothetical protein